MTQIDTILKHLKTHKKGLTQKEAWERYGCSRLSAVITTLEDKGYKFKHIRETVPGRYGKVSVTRYKIGE